jgi:protein SCO1
MTNVTRDFSPNIARGRGQVRLGRDAEEVRYLAAAPRLGRGVALVAALLLASSCVDDGPGALDASALAGAVRAPALEVVAISLPDVGNGGEPVPMQAPPGELLLVYFGYTSCPDVCPTTMSDLKVALDGLPDALASRVTVAMTTVDPERDTDEVLTGYLGFFFDDNSMALRAANPDTLAEAAEAFGVTWEIEAHSPGDAYMVAHTAVTYVVDDTGTVVVEWPFGFTPADMTNDLQILLTKEPT